jgi:hypothetical protein
MPDDEQSWAWPEATWRGIVGKVRAGGSLLPASSPGDARVAVALSFDSDHEASTLRAAERSPGKLDRASALRPYTAPSAVLEIFRAEFDGACEEGGSRC